MRTLVQVAVPGLLLAFAAMAAALPGAGFALDVYRLSNGLEVVLAPDLHAATCTVLVTYKAGSRQEQPGRTGLAHLLEHMMFRGSANIGRGEHAAVIVGLGGVYNGSTGTDRTVYHETLPYAQLPVALELEAGRMQGLRLDPADLELERKVVLEEFRKRTERPGIARVREILNLKMSSEFGLRHAVLGAARDIEALTVKDVSAFYGRYYAANNAVLIVVGRFDRGKARRLIGKFFGGIPPAPVVWAAPPVTAEPEPPSAASVIEDAAATRARVDIGFLLPPGNSRDWYAMLAAGHILAGSARSRLEKLVLSQGNLRVSSSWSTQPRLSRPLGVLSVALGPGVDAATAEPLIRNAILSFASAPVTREELQEYRASAARDYFSSAETTAGRADLLSQFVTFYQDANLLDTYLDRAREVGAEDLQKAALRYLAPDRLFTVITKQPPRVSAETAAAQ